MVNDMSSGSVDMLHNRPKDPFNLYNQSNYCMKEMTPHETSFFSPGSKLLIGTMSVEIEFVSVKKG